MRILFLCSWKIEDMLTVSTVVPQLQFLTQLKYINKIVLVTLEEGIKRLNTDNEPQAELQHSKISWEPVVTLQYPVKLANQIINYSFIPLKITQIARKYNIESLLAHGAPAGALAYKVWQKTKLPFYVSSFEPHADYMFESGVWSKYGLKYYFQKEWEKQQKKYAAGLMPVAESYKALLLAEGVRADKIKTVPCSVQPDSFKFNLRQREEVRARLKMQNCTIGIYVGKYGSLYLEDEAFEIYSQCFKTYSSFRLIILSPQGEAYMQKKLVQHGINPSRVYTASVPHHEVPAYLSAADFGFATIKSYPSARYCSPVKIGEYWANGLPVLLTEGVGDDSEIIKSEGGGAVYSLAKAGSLEQALQKIEAILQEPEHRQEIAKLAQKYRSFDRVREAYAYFFGEEKGIS